MRYFNTAGPVRSDEHYCLPQTADYMDRCGGNEGHLVLFDRDEDTAWDEKIFRRDESHDGRTITVWGM